MKFLLGAVIDLNLVVWLLALRNFTTNFEIWTLLFHLDLSFLTL